MRPKQYFGHLLLIVVSTLLAVSSVTAQKIKGLEPGVKAPDFKLKDQEGKRQTLTTLAGPNGLLLLFFRSADWCPFCKGQLVDLQGMQKAFAAKGINVAAISYDSPAILESFTKRKEITYPMLSDTSSSVINAYKIRNEEATGIEQGIPYPGFYLIDRQGIIQKRYFETAYYNRLTASSLYANLFGDYPLPAPSKELPATPHVTIQTMQSDAEVTPGAVFQLAVAITPGPDTHVYAPGAEKLNYHVVSLSIVPSKLYTAAATDYPKSEMMTFPELSQTVPVYTERTVLSASIAPIVDKDTFKAFASSPDLPVQGEVRYQACTSKVCYPPIGVAVAWDVRLRQFDLERAPENIQHK